MKYLDLTLPTPEANLACDEALLEFCEENESCEILRVWEPQSHFVVAGYANRIAGEVNQETCRAHDFPILRRCSGGGTVLQGPGCLNYALVLKIERRAELAGISHTNHFVMEVHRNALQSALQTPVEILGHTDLVIDRRKFSGNAQRRKKNSLIFHGSFLLDLDLSLVERTLSFPSKPPDYRQARSHLEFLTNLKIPSSRLRELLRSTWKASSRFDEIPWARIEHLVKTKYSLQEWNFKF